MHKRSKQAFLNLSYQNEARFSIGTFCCKVGNQAKSSQASYSMVFFVEQQIPSHKSGEFRRRPPFWSPPEPQKASFAVAHPRCCWLVWNCCFSASISAVTWPNMGSNGTKLCPLKWKRCRKMPEIAELFELLYMMTISDLSHWSTKFQSPPSPTQHFTINQTAREVWTKMEIVCSSLLKLQAQADPNSLSNQTEPIWVTRFTSTSLVEPFIILHLQRLQGGLQPITILPFSEEVVLQLGVLQFQNTKRGRALHIFDNRTRLR